MKKIFLIYVVAGSALHAGWEDLIVMGFLAGVIVIVDSQSTKTEKIIQALRENVEREGQQVVDTLTKAREELADIRHSIAASEARQIETRNNFEKSIRGSLKAIKKAQAARTAEEALTDVGAFFAGIEGNKVITIQGNIS